MELCKISHRTSLIFKMQLKNSLINTKTRSSSGKKLFQRVSKTSWTQEMIQKNKDTSTSMMMEKKKSMRLSDGWQSKFLAVFLLEDQLLRFSMNKLPLCTEPEMTSIHSSKQLTSDGWELMLLLLSKSSKTQSPIGLTALLPSSLTTLLKKYRTLKLSLRKLQPVSKYFLKLLRRNLIKSSSWESWLTLEMLRWSKTELSMRLNQWNKLFLSLKSIR